MLFTLLAPFKRSISEENLKSRKEGI